MSDEREIMPPTGPVPVIYVEPLNFRDRHGVDIPVPMKGARRPWVYGDEANPSDRYLAIERSRAAFDAWVDGLAERKEWNSCVASLSDEQLIRAAWGNLSVDRPWLTLDQARAYLAPYLEQRREWMRQRSSDAFDAWVKEESGE